jgi:hypothetical protein
LLAPLEHSMFAYAAFWGRLVFGDLPAARTLVGAAIILGGGSARAAALSHRAAQSMSAGLETRRLSTDAALG